MDRFYTFFSIYKNQLENEMLVFISGCVSVCPRVEPTGWRLLPGGSWGFPLRSPLLLAEGIPLIHCDLLKLRAKTSWFFPLNLLSLCSQLVNPVDYKDVIFNILAVHPSPELCRRRSLWCNGLYC